MHPFRPTSGRGDVAALIPDGRLWHAARVDSGGVRGVADTFCVRRQRFRRRSRVGGSSCNDDADNDHRPADDLDNNDNDNVDHDHDHLHDHNRARHVAEPGESAS